MMTDTVLISLVGAAATVVVSMVNAGFAFLSNRRGKRNEEHLVETKQAVMAVQNQTNGMSESLAKVTGQKEYARGQHEGDALLKVSREAEFAKGLKQGAEEGKQL